MNRTYRTLPTVHAALAAVALAIASPAAWAEIFTSATVAASSSADNAVLAALRKSIADTNPM